MKTPVVLVFNLRLSVYDMFGTSYFNQIRERYPSIYLMPIVNNLNEGIEQRASKINYKLSNLLSSIRAQQAHLMSYSVSGLDARYAISALNLGQKLKSLTTIATPNLGSKAANMSERNFLRKSQIEPIARLMGIGIKPFHQVVPDNIKFFNEQITDAQNVEYFSVGAEQMPNICNHALRDVGNYLRTNVEKNYTYQNDGVFGHDQIQWGQHLTNFTADHSEVIGLTKDLRKIQTFDLILENIASLENGSQTQKSAFSS